MWWIPRQQHKESVEEVSKVLEYLVKEGFVRKKILHDGRNIYSAVKGEKSGNNNRNK